MPITVELWTALSSPNVEDRVVGVVLPRDLEGDVRFELLKWVDPWGDTVFNRAQCRSLVAELLRAEEIFGSDVFSRLVRLAERAASEPHLYLVFIGD